MRDLRFLIHPVIQSARPGQTHQMHRESYLCGAEIAPGVGAGVAWEAGGVYTRGASGVGGVYTGGSAWVGPAPGPIWPGSFGLISGSISTPRGRTSKAKLNSRSRCRRRSSVSGNIRMGRPAWETAKKARLQVHLFARGFAAQDHGNAGLEKIDIVSSPFDFNNAIGASHPHA